jgi:Tfp pilus assembly protein PilE
MEFLVASTIVVLLTLMTYVPYSHYQNKAKIKIASREISQSFYESKNMAT